MSELSIELLKDPFNVGKWNNLFKSPELRATKRSSAQKIEAIRSIYADFLKIYPLLENYWLKYIDFEFELDNLSECNKVYDKAFQYLSYSPRLWMKYLNFKLLTEPVSDETSLLQYLKLFECARGYIGHNYYAADFYKLYLEFLQRYEVVGPQLEFRMKYEFLLRYCVELPLYNYSHFFKTLLGEFDAGNLRYLKLSKKIITEMYIVTQSKAFVLYEYEKKLVNFFNLEYISNNEIHTWCKYLQHIELNYPNQHTIQTYERAVIRTSDHDDIYVQYCNYLIGQKKYDMAIEVLKRALSVRNFNKTKLTDKLVDLQLYKANYLTAKSLATGTSLPKLVSLEWLFGNRGVLEQLFKVTQRWELLLFYNLDDDTVLKFFNMKDVEKTQSYYNALNLWLKHHPQYKSQFEISQKATFEEELNAFL